MKKMTKLRCRFKGESCLEIIQGCSHPSHSTERAGTEMQGSERERSINDEEMRQENEQERSENEQEKSGSAQGGDGEISPEMTEKALFNNQSGAGEPERPRHEQGGGGEISPEMKKKSTL